ncbi:MAG: hypothetical protein L3K00_08010 [Thermoplasmata archaeon]|nr:hypothetical protein [Thermoplasmata archaeon]
MAADGADDGSHARARPHWTIYATAVLTGVLVILGVVPYVTGATVSWYEAAIAVLAVGAAAELLLAGHLFRYPRGSAAAGKIEPPGPSEPAVSSELLNRWKTMRDRVWIAFTTRDRPGSMLMAEAGILSMLNGQHNAGRLTASEDGNRERAFAARGAYGWLVAHTALGWALWILENYAGYDGTAFGAAMEIIQTVATEGRNAADEWVDIVRQAGATKLGNQARDEWARFRDPANLTLNDLATLVADTYRETKSGVPFRLDLIREI